MDANVKTNRKISTKDMVFIPMMSVIIAICSWLSIGGAVPFTLQTFAVFVTVMILGGKKGTASILLYLFLGGIGLPVFAGFKGGFAALIGPTGGYLIGFLCIGIIFILAEKIFSGKLWVRISALVLGNIICYAFGTAWFSFVFVGESGKMGFLAALSLCVVPYLIPDAIKLILAVLVGERVRKIVFKD